MEPVANPNPVPCKVCGHPSVLCGVVDFHKSCLEAYGKRLSLAGIPIYYRRCGGCGFLFTEAFDGWEDAVFLARIYNDDYLVVDPEFVEVRPLANARLVAESFRASREAMTILDFGGGCGRLAEVLTDEGFQAATYDPFSVHREPPAGQFDLITCFEVLEHSPKPKQTVAAIVGLLADGGAVLFSTLVQPANIETVGLNWWYVGPRNGHVSLYSMAALAQVFAEHGMRVASFSDGMHMAYRRVPEFARHLRLPREGEPA